MNQEDLWALAQDATCIVAGVAATTAQQISPNATRSPKDKNILRNLGLLAGRMMKISKTLESPTLHEEEIIMKRLSSFLGILEELCKWKQRCGMQSSLNCSQGKYPTVYALVDRQEHPDRGILTAALMAFAAEEQKLMDKCWHSLDSFLVDKRGFKTTQEAPPTSREQGSRVRVPSEEHRSYVNKVLYRVLSLPCTCSPVASGGRISEEHWARLRLNADDVVSPNTALFDVVLSSAPCSHLDVNLEWQQILFEIPKHEPPDEKPVRAKVRFAGTMTTQATKEKIEAAEQGQTIQPERFCQFLSTPFGNVRTRLKIDKGNLHHLRNPANPDQTINPKPSIALSKALDGAALSSKGKIFLAYILAKSIWQYYDSDFMRIHWTTASIHFMLECPKDPENGQQQTEIDTSKPYFAFESDGKNDL